MRAVAVALAALAVGGVLAGAAAAHGDPASEYLVDHDVFFPIGKPLPGVAQARIGALVAEAKQRGYPIRVALIGTRFDLGTEGNAWLRPQAYAKALDADLAYYDRGPLLVVMPNGFGLAQPGHAIAADLSVLARVRHGAGLEAAAERAIVRLAAAHGVAVSVPSRVTTPAARDRHDRIVIVAATVAILLAWLLGRRVVRRRSAAPAQPS